MILSTPVTYVSSIIDCHCWLVHLIEIANDPFANMYNQPLDTDWYKSYLEKYPEFAQKTKNGCRKYGFLQNWQMYLIRMENISKD